MKRIVSLALSRYAHLAGGLVALTITGWFVWSFQPGTISGRPGQPAARDLEAAVIGVYLGGQAKAYPLQALGAEVLNDEVGGRPIVVTF